MPTRTSILSPVSSSSYLKTSRTIEVIDSSGSETQELSEREVIDNRVLTSAFAPKPIFGTSEIQPRPLFSSPAHLQSLTEQIEASRVEIRPGKADLSMQYALLCARVTSQETEISILDHQIKEAEKLMSMLEAQEALKTKTGTKRKADAIDAGTPSFKF